MSYSNNDVFRNKPNSMNYDRPFSMLLNNFQTSTFISAFTVHFEITITLNVNGQ